MAAEAKTGLAGRRWVRRLARIGTCLLALLVLPLLVSGFDYYALGGQMHWSEARRDSSRQAPDAASHPEPVIQVYAARAWGWRGAVGVHTWIATKRTGATGYKRHEVMGWGVRYGRSAVRSWAGIPDAYWYGSNPDLLLDLRGAGLDPVIDRIEAAVAAYPHTDSYTLWPGPNSNTFTAFVARRVPELRVDLPPTAIGKDYLVDGLLGRAPSGTGFQISLKGLAGLMLALEEGLEINLLGLTFGLDFSRPALKLPGLGRIGA